MCKEMKKFKQTNDALRKKNDDMEDRISKLHTKLDQYVNIIKLFYNESDASMMISSIIKKERKTV